MVSPPLSQATGYELVLVRGGPGSLSDLLSHPSYGVVVGLGAVFAVRMVLISNLLARRGNVEDTEEFTVAKRSVGAGLTASGVVSAWTW